MKKIYNYTTFLNENIQEKEDFSDVMKVMLELPTEEILKFRDELKMSVNESVINESFSVDFFYKLKNKFRRWFTDKLFDYLINRKKEYYEKLVDKLNIFDLYSLRDVKESFPSFELKSMYLAGGMDAAKKGGKVGWRNIVEHELEINHPGSKKNFPEITMYLGPDGDKEVKMKPSYVIDDNMLDVFIANPKKTLKLYDYPAILNPVRKEVDRNKMNFEDSITALKRIGSTQDEIDKAVLYFRNVVSKSLAYYDELLINKSDCVYLGLNSVAGAGTYAELQMLSFIEKPLFCVLVEGYEGIVGNFKLWNMPQLCKLARNQEEMLVLTDTLWQFANQ